MVVVAKIVVGTTMAVAMKVEQEVKVGEMTVMAVMMVVMVVVVVVVMLVVMVVVVVVMMAVMAVAVVMVVSPGFLVQAKGWGKS